MDRHIGSLHCRYFVTEPAQGVELVNCLDRVARERLPESMMEALDSALAHDSTVYIVRSVKAQLALQAEGSFTDQEIGQQWGKCLARAVMRAISGDRSGSANLVTFTSEADYTAQFIVDLIRGTAWERWFYAPFSYLRNDLPSTAIQRILAERSDQAPLILKQLQARGAIADVVSTMGSLGVEFVWRQFPQTLPGTGAEALRPLLRVAVALMRGLDFEFEESPDIESLTQSFMARNVVPVDWRDPSSLSLAVWAMMVHVIEAKVARYAQVQTPEQLLPRIQQALNAFEWLDRAWLERAIVELLSSAQNKQSPEAVPVLSGIKPAMAAWLEQAMAGLPSHAEGSAGNPSSLVPDSFKGESAFSASDRGDSIESTALPRAANRMVTPRQQRLLGDLLDSFRACRQNLDLRRPAGSENALQLYACLLDRHPNWTDDSGVAPMIQRFLEAVESFRTGKGEAAGFLGNSPDQAAFRNPLSGSELKLARLLALDAGDIRGSQGGIATQCAGLFLLLRAIMDLGLPRLAERAQYPASELSLPFPAVMLAFGLCCAGSSGIQHGRVDAGLSLLAGLDMPPEIEVLREAWRSASLQDHLRFQPLLLQALVSRRVAGGSIMHVFKLPLADSGSALIVADEQMRSAIMGQRFTAGLNTAAAVASWIENWKTCFGETPKALVVDECLAEELDWQSFGLDVSAAAEPPFENTQNETANTHYEIRQDLVKSLSSLYHGLLHNPEAEFSMALVAIAVLRTWARWLRQFAGSSVPYLLDSFIRRPGQINFNNGALIARMESRPLDIVLEMAGYTAELENVAWLKHRRIQFNMKGA